MNPKSTAAVRGHPLHPMLVVFPIAFWVGAFVLDIAFLAGAPEGVAEAALVCVAVGLVTALLAAVAGLIDFAGSRDVRSIPDARRHMIGNIVAVLIAVASVAVRVEQGAAEAVAPWGILTTAALTLLLLYTGWKGGELVYRHHVGVQEDHPDAGVSRSEQRPGSRPGPRRS